MHWIIINCSPRAVKNSNTDKIIQTLLTGYRDDKHTAEVYRLSQRASWPAIREAYEANDHILFALPLFVECVPALMLEFLETLPPKAESANGKAHMAFLVQGGFAEASQLRCCEAYLKTLPQYFNCAHAGTLIKGNMFGAAFVAGKSQEQMLSPFVEMGRHLKEHDGFEPEAVTAFAAPEYFDQKTIKMLKLFTPIQNMMFRSIAKKQGCKTSLLARPYEQYVVKNV